jgi:RNase P/RNase MRP subunit p30
MISTSNFQQAKDQIKKEIQSKIKLIIVKSQNQEFDRKILEYGKFDILLSPELNQERDKIKYLNSGFNHVLAEIAAKNKIALGVDVSALNSIKDKKIKAQKLSRIIQNIKVCRKAKCSIALVNYKDKINAFNFLISLGASTKQAKQALSF